MEEYIVSARKYRPMTFDTVVGQSALTTTLRNAVRSGKLAHAYLFCGPRGVGKTTCARIFAKAINCMHPTADGEACGECESCVASNEQRSFNVFELDAASNNSVENIKSLMEQTRIPPQIGRYKVFIIDEVHMLSTAAFNAFLKTLEEPPAHVIFILATTEKHKILPTIISRCQIYDFERMTVKDTIEHLKNVAAKEGITFEEEALAVIAEKADGGMRDALSIFDQAASFCQGNITYKKVIEDLNELDSDNYFRIVDLALENKVSDIMLLLDTIIGNGFDGGNLVNGLASHIRNVLMAKDERTIKLLEVSQQRAQKYAEQAKKITTKFAYSALRILNKCDLSYRQSSNKRLLVEITLIQVAQLTQGDDDDASAGRSPKRLKSLFKYLISSPTEAAKQVAAVGKTLHRAHNSGATTTANANNSTAESHLSTAQQAENGTQKKPTLQLKNIGMTFAKLQTEKQETAHNEAEDIDSSGEKQSFDQEKLEFHWLAMCNRMPEEMKGIASRMKNMQLKITVFPHIEVIVENQNLLEQFDKISRRIRTTLIKELQNDDITLTARLATHDEIVPLLTGRELLESMKKNYPTINKLCEELHLETV